MANENKKISQNRQKKEVIVTDVTAKVKKAQGMVFTNYQGLTHQQLEILKKELKKADAEFAVVKNTLMKIALKEHNLDQAQQDEFQKPLGTLFMYSDVVTPLKALTKSIKDFQLPSIKFGIIDGKAYNNRDIVKLSTLPSIDVLRAQLLGMMNSPIQGLHRALSWNLTKFAMTLQAIADKKGQTA